MLKNQLPLSASFCRRLLKGIVAFAIVVMVVAMLRSTVLDWDEVPSGSMTPTILQGDRICENKLAYDLKLPFTTARMVTWNDPKRGDVVIFISPRSGQRLVKRIVGVPGDVVELGGSATVLPAGKFFVMGDNRDHSLDSRSFGPIDRSRILGKAVGVIASFDPNQNGHPRWSRFFASL